MMIACMLCVSLSITAVQVDATKALIDLENRLARAWVDGDRAFIDALLAPDWSVTDAAGAVFTKQQVFEQVFASTERRIDAMTIDDVKVRLYGDMAVVTGRTRATGSNQGRSGTATLRFTDVFVLRGDRWLIVASHGSSVAP